MSTHYSKLLISTFAAFGFLFAVSASAVDDVTPPGAVTDLVVTSVSSSSAGFSWTAPGDDNATGTAASYDFRYRTLGPIDEMNFATSTAVTGEPSPHVASTTESFVVNGLTPTTTYWFALRATDEAGNTSALSNVVSTTTPADTTAPVISGIAVSNITATSSHVLWSTNEAASSQVNYGTTTSYGSSTASSTLVMSHALDLMSLLPSTLYHFFVLSADAFGNTASSSDQTFTTLASTTPPTTTPPTATTTIAARLKIEPKVLNHKREGRKFTAVVKLPKGTTFEGLDLGSIRLNDTVKPIKANLKPKEWKRWGHMRRTLTLKFAAADVLPLIPTSTNQFTFTITGNIKAGTFQGTDTVRIIPPVLKPLLPGRLQKKIEKIEERIEEAEERLEKKQEELKEREEKLKEQLEKKQSELKKKEEKLREQFKKQEEQLKKKVEKLKKKNDD